MDAQKIPKDAEAIEAATINAAKVPLETAQAGLDVLAILGGLEGMTNVNAASDLAVARLLCDAGIRGALENVNINLDGIKDEAAAGDLSRKAAEILKALP